VLDGEISTALTELNELAKGGKDLGRLLSDLLNHFRNLLIYQVSKGDLKLLETSEAETAAIKEQVALAGTDALTRILEALADAELRLRDAASKKILLEVTLLRAIEARNALSIDAVLKQLNQLRSNAPQTVASAPAAVSPAPERRVFARPEPTPAPPISKPAEQKLGALTVLSDAPVVSAPASGNLTELWARLVEAVGKASPFTRGYLMDAHPVSFDKGIFVIGFDPEFEDHLGLVDNSRNHTLLATKLSELGHPNAMIKFVKSAVPAGWERPVAPVPATAPVASKPSAPTPASKTAASAPAPAVEKKSAPVAFNKDEFKNDPLIKKALEIFKGTIVEVRA
jgi:DNA polymerase-3 subunit gamma/tau